MTLKLDGVMTKTLDRFSHQDGHLVDALQGAIEAMGRGEPYEESVIHMFTLWEEEGGWSVYLISNGVRDHE